MNNYIYLAFLWVLYFVIHSSLAGNLIKNFIKEKSIRLYPFYRICFNIIALISLFAVLYYQNTIKGSFLFDTSLLTSIIGYSIAFIGVVIGYLAFNNYSGMEFAGLDFNKSKEEEKIQLNTSGLNKYVRHPLYFATLLMVWGYFIALPDYTNLIMNIVISIYLIIGTKLEEKKLILEFGNDYEKYIEDVPMLIPTSMK